MIAIVFYMYNYIINFWGNKWSPKLLSTLWYFMITFGNIIFFYTRKFTDCFARLYLFKKVLDTGSENQPFCVKKNPRIKWTFHRFFSISVRRKYIWVMYCYHWLLACNGLHFPHIRFNFIIANIIILLFDCLVLLKLSTFFL